MMSKVEDWPIRAKRMVVVDDETNAAAADMLLGIKDLEAEVNATFEPLKKKAHEAWKAICDEQKRHLSPLSEAERILKASIGSYAMEQQRKLEEARRIHAEQVRRAEEEARRQAEEQLERDIEAAEREGAMPEEIEAMIAAPLEVAPVHVAPPPRKVEQPKGISIPMRTVVRVDNPLLLLRFIADNPQFINLVEFDQAGLNKMASALGTAMRWPGVTLIREPIVRVGGRR
jgi:hypothetical protein